MTHERDVNLLVEAHSIAQRRIKKGQSPWAGTLNFLPALMEINERLDNGDDTLTAQMILDAIHAAAREVRTKVPQAKETIMASEHEDLEYFLDVFEGFTLDRVNACECLAEELDPAIAHLYDWADINRWWISPHA